MGSTANTWPATGPWAASYRVMFAVLAVWAAIVVPAWYLFGLAGASPGWHVHEMVFGIGGGALAGYLPTACTSWTGRAPVSGRPVVVLVALWILARALMVVPVGTVPPWLLAPGVGAVFWWIAFLTAREMHLSGRGRAEVGGYPPSLVVFCLVAGVASGWFAVALTTQQPFATLSDGVVLLFTMLLTGVGGRMVPAFLNTAADRAGLPQTPVHARWRRVVLVLIGVAIVAAPWLEVSALAGLAAAAVLVAHMARWPWRAVRLDALATMTLFAYAWIPVGLVCWGAARLGWVDISTPTVSHTLTIGALSGLVIAVASRAPARRGRGRLHVRPAALAGFVAVMLSAALRLVDLTVASSWCWSLGWALFLVGHLPAFSDPMPRPIFSARRLPHA